MDIDMPGMNGIEGVKLIRKNFPTVQILMLTVFDDDEKVFAAIKAGAGGYILKNAEPQNLLHAISEVYNGGAPMTPGIARKVLHQFQTILPEEKKDYHLSIREKEVLGLLVDGLSYKMIAGKLNITYDTVRAHMKKIYEKLHVASMTEAVAKAINQKLFQIGLFYLPKFNTASLFSLSMLLFNPLILHRVLPLLVIVVKFIFNLFCSHFPRNQSEPSATHQYDKSKQHFL